MIDWESSSQKWAHKACKGQFLKDIYLAGQQRLETPREAHSADIPAHDDISNEDAEPRRSDRIQLSYSSSWSNDLKKRCIICNENKWAKGRLIPVQTISIINKAQEKLVEYANIHITNNNEKYRDGAKRILLTLSTKTLLAADVGYHKQICYEPFRSPVWKRNEKGGFQSASSDEDGWEEMYQLVNVHIISRQEIYTMSQLTSAFNQIRAEKGLSECRTTDLRQKLEDKFDTKLQFNRPLNNSPRSSDYVLPEGMEFTGKCIEAVIIGGGIPKSVTLRNAARCIHHSIIDTRRHIPWPPTPQDILDNEPDINNDLYIELCLIINPDARLNDNGRVDLAPSKASKVSQICQDLQALLPNAQPSLDQVLLSLTMHAKTGSSTVVDTLHNLGYGLSYTETVFIEDKWAVWSKKQHSNIPSNMRKGIPTTHVADNIDWKNKDLIGTETHNTHSILIQQKCPVPAESGMRKKAQVSVVPDYNFTRKEHRSFKAERTELPQYIPTKAGPIPLEYQEVTNTNESSTSSKKTVAWAKCRMNTHADAQHAQNVPALSAFWQLTTKEYPPGVNVGYMPAITAPPTSMNVILAILNRTVECMNELELKFIFLEVLQVLFKYHQEQSIYFDNIIVRMGGFHIMMCLMKTIYSRFQGCGLVELLSEAGVGSEGTIKAGLSGSNVKQGIRYYKLLFEALLRSKIAYLDDLQIDRVYTETLETSADASDCQMIHDSSDHTRMPQSSDDASGHPAGGAAQYATSSTGDPSNSSSTDSDSTWLSEQLTVLRIEQTADNLEKVVSHPTMTVPPPLIGGMATWMDSFIEMVDLLLNMIHFQRTGNFEGFLETIHQFLPWCFGLNRHNYARNMSYYYVDMRDFKNRNPDAYQFLCDGGFTGSITGERSTKIPMDQIIEMTESFFKRNRRTLWQYRKCWCQPTMDEDKSLPCSFEATSGGTHQGHENKPCWAR